MFAPISALQALERERRRSNVTTFSRALDDLFGGAGVPAGRVTELCGPPGIGKTQIGMQLSLNAQIPPNPGAPWGESIYVDTEGSFIIERVAEIASETLSELARLSHQLDSSVTVESLLSRIHYFRIHGHVEQIALMNQLEGFLKAHPQVKIIVIDSIAFHFRQNFTDMGLRTRLLNGMAQQFRKFADENDLAVVLMNQMTTKILRTNQSDSSSATLVPALGDSWGHACTNRVILFWQNNVRHAVLTKSPNMQERTVQYAITVSFGFVFVVAWQKLLLISKVLDRLLAYVMFRKMTGEARNEPQN
ncbi:DNA repair protein rad51c [Borealophlyctis nickersoniae]|nr:DNA repair protein rad51c [Borealophlyctis nickersoniae]